MVRWGMGWVLVACSPPSEGGAPTTDVVEGPSDPATPGDPTSEEPAEGRPTDLPEAQEACPELTEGDVTVLGRQVRLWVAPDAAERGPGPLVFYWAASLSQPGEVTVNFMPVVDAVVAQGGVVAALYPEPCEGCEVSSGLPWWYVEDLEVADEVLACAIEQVGIDTRRIHAAGTSAGAIHTAEMMFRRSNYLASVAVYSGGLAGPEAVDQVADPSNLVPALVAYAETADWLADMSEAFADMLTDWGHLAVRCVRPVGHGIAPDLAPSVAAFFEAHPYRGPAGWAGALPDSVDAGCTL